MTQLTIFCEFLIQIPAQNGKTEDCFFLGFCMITDEVLLDKLGLRLGQI